MDSTTSRDRVLHVQRASGLKPKPFSVACGLSPALIGMLDREDIKSPELGTLKKIAGACAEQEDRPALEAWLVLGLGEPPTSAMVQGAPAIAAALAKRAERDTDPDDDTGPVPSGALADPSTSDGVVPAAERRVA